MNRSWLLRRLAGAAALVVSAGFLLYAFVAWRAAWALVSQPADDVGTSVAQGELLLATINAILQPVLLFATAITAFATWRTVREMREGRIQERQLELHRREDATRVAIRRDAWLLIGNVYAVTALVGGLSAMNRKASRFGRVRGSVEQPMMQASLRSTDRVADAMIAASRLQDMPGPWAAPAGELAQLVLDIVGVSPDVERAMALANQVADPVQRLRDALPG